MQILALHHPDKENSDSFAERAENYYSKRPQLLSLLQDLHKSYLHLADRYSQQSLLPKLSPFTSISSSDIDESDAESSLSFQHLQPTNNFINGHNLDELITALVVSRVEREVMAGSDWDRWARKAEVLENLVEVLESERAVLMMENSRVKLRGEEAGRRAEEARREVVGLRRRNGEWYEAMVRREREEGEVRMEVERLREENRRLRNRSLSEAVRRSGRKGWWWERVRRGGGVIVKGSKGGGCFGDNFYCL